MLLQKLNKDIIIYIFKFIYDDLLIYKNGFWRILIDKNDNTYKSFIDSFNKISKPFVFLKKKDIIIKYLLYKYIFNKNNNFDDRLFGINDFLKITYNITYNIDLLNNLNTIMIVKSIKKYIQYETYNNNSHNCNYCLKTYIFDENKNYQYELYNYEN
jgi:hypothetical protein